MAKSFDEFKKIYDAELKKFDVSDNDGVLEEEYKGYLSLCDLLGVDSDVYAERDECGNVEIIMKPIYPQPRT